MKSKDQQNVTILIHEFLGNTVSTINPLEMPLLDFLIHRILFNRDTLPIRPLLCQYLALWHLY